MKFITIPDINGCHQALERFLQEIEDISHSCIFLGDYIDRGPSSSRCSRRPNSINMLFFSCYWKRTHIGHTAKSSRMQFSSSPGPCSRRAKEKNCMIKTLSKKASTIEIRIESSGLSLRLKTNFFWLVAALAALSQTVLQLFQKAP